jgi:serine/threonine-protein kinase
MEFLEGKSLANVITDEWPLSDERIVSVLSQALAALARAHEMAIIHRDLKPENIMLLPETNDEGHAIEHVKVCDFGVAKFVEDGPPEEPPVPTARTSSSTQTTLTAHGMTVGTPAYMSPEQALGDRTDARSDLYQIGVILFQLLTRRLPFEANTTIKVMLKQVEEPPPMPSEVAKGVNPRLEAICLRALKKKAEHRYQSAREMRAELRAVVDPTAPTPAESRKANTVPPSRSAEVRAAKAARGGGIPTLAILIIACALLVCVAILVLTR